MSQDDLLEDDIRRARAKQPPELRERVCRICGPFMLSSCPAAPEHDLRPLASAPIHTFRTGEPAPEPAAGPWVAVSEREPVNRAVVLALWADGAVRVVEWTPKEYEGKPDGPRRFWDIWLAHMPACAVGIRTWPTHWAELHLPEPP